MNSSEELPSIERMTRGVIMKVVMTTRVPANHAIEVPNTMASEVEPM